MTEPFIYDLCVILGSDIGFESYEYFVLTG
jgi:hypothetical protein